MGVDHACQLTATSDVRRVAIEGRHHDRILNDLLATDGYFRTLNLGEGRHISSHGHGTLRWSGCEPPGIRLFPIFPFDGAIVMVIISLEVVPPSGWRVCRSRVSLFSSMQLIPAITLAREMARDEYRRSGRGIRVETPGRADFPSYWRGMPKAELRQARMRRQPG